MTSGDLATASTFSGGREGTARGTGAHTQALFGWFLDDTEEFRVGSMHRAYGGRQETMYVQSYIDRPSFLYNYMQQHYHLLDIESIAVLDFLGLMSFIQCPEDVILITEITFFTHCT